MKRTGRLLPIVAFALAAIPSLLLVRDVGTTIRDRFDAELVDDALGGIIADHVVRVRRGEPVYVQADATFCPVIYTPLYYAAAATLAPLAGDELRACRATSIGCVGLATLLAAVIASTASSAPLAMAAAVVVAATGYSACGFQYDTPRVDPLSSFAVLAAVLLVMRPGSVRGGILVGAVLAVGFFAKQSAAIFAAPFLTVLFFENRRRGVAAVVTFATLLGAGVAWGSAVTDGWFWRIAILMPREHPVELARLGQTWFTDWRRPFLAPLVTVAAAAALTAPGGASATDRRFRILLGALASVLLMTTLSRARDGGTIKTLMPACLMFAAIVPAAVVRLTRWRSPLGGVAGAALLAWIAVAGRFPSEDARPGAAGLEGWRTMRAEVARHAESGPVWAATRGYITTTMAGQSMRPGLLALNDWMRNPSRPVPPDLARALEAREFAAIVYPLRSRDTRLRDQLERYYEPAKPLPPVEVGLRDRVVPLAVWTPRPPPPIPSPGSSTVGP